MFNGKCKINGDEGVLRAKMILDTPSGPLEWEENIGASEPNAKERLVRKARYVAGFFPTREMVGSDAYSEAERLYKSYVNGNDSEREEIGAEIDTTVEDAAGGNHDAFDTAYALDRIVAARSEEIGASFLKKMKKKIGKVVKSPIAQIAFPPAAVYNLVKNARKSPALMNKIKTIAKVAVFPPAALAMMVKDSKGRPAPAAKVQEIQQQAQQADAYIQQAEEIQQAAYEETGDYDSFAPASYDEGYASEYSEYPESYGGENEEEFIGLALYKAGATVDDASDEEVSGLFDVAKKLGRIIDPTKKGSPIRFGLAAIPGIGPEVKAGLDLLDAAKKGGKDAVDKLKTIKDLAGAGVPKAQQAMDNLKTAQNLDKQMQKEVAQSLNPGKKGWFPGSGIYSKGAAS